MSKLTHLTEAGAAHMVDVSQKADTDREARAEAHIALSAEALEAIRDGTAPKGDVLASARIAGIMAAKKTSELIPLCHPIALTRAVVDFEMLEDSIRIIATAKTNGPTGVEMEALTAAAVAALTIYDMVKAVDKAAVIGGVRLLAKSGGKSGNYTAPDKAGSPKPKSAKPASAHKAPATVQSTRGRASPTTLMGEVIGPRNPASADGMRENFRAFMTSRRLRATTWAKDAEVPVGEILSFLTGRVRGLSSETAKRLARAAKVRVEEMFR